MNMRSDLFNAALSRCQLGEVLEFRNEIVHPKDRPSGTATFVGLEHIERDTGVRIGSDRIDLAEMTGRRARFRAGDIVYGYLRPYLNKVWIADFDGLCSVDQYVFKTHEGVDRSYVAHFLRSIEFLKTAPIDSAPGQLPRIRSGEIAETLIPLPTLDEQHRIVAILDKADALRRKRKRVLGLLDDLMKSLFVQIFGSAEAIAMRWDRHVSLSEIAEISSGITKGRKQPTSPLRSVPYLAVANVQDHALDMSLVKSIEASEDEIEKLRLREGDLVLTEGGDPDKLGRGTIWKNELPEAIHQNHIFRVRIITQDVEENYLMHLIGSRYGKAYFLRAAKQTTGIASINKKQLSEMCVPMPPIELQKKFSQELGRLADIEKRATEASTSVDTFFASLQHRAFAGQL